MRREGRGWMGRGRSELGFVAPLGDSSLSRQRLALATPGAHRLLRFQGATGNRPVSSWCTVFALRLNHPCCDVDAKC